MSSRGEYQPAVQGRGVCKYSHFQGASKAGLCKYATGSNRAIVYAFVGKHSLTSTLIPGTRRFATRVPEFPSCILGDDWKGKQSVGWQEGASHGARYISTNNIKKEACFHFIFLLFCIFSIILVLIAHDAYEEKWDSLINIQIPFCAALSVKQLPCMHAYIFQFIVVYKFSGTHSFLSSIKSTSRIKWLFVFIF